MSLRRRIVRLLVFIFLGVRLPSDRSEQLLTGPPVLLKDAIHALVDRGTPAEALKLALEIDQFAKKFRRNPRTGTYAFEDTPIQARAAGRVLVHPIEILANDLPVQARNGVL